jgi:hypothetical protein
MKSRVSKKRVNKKISLNLGLLFVAIACGQHLSAESHYVAPRYAMPSFAPEPDIAPGLPQDPPALDQDTQDSKEQDSKENAQYGQKSGQENGRESGVVMALPYFGPIEPVIEDEEQVLESSINVPGDED